MSNSIQVILSAVDQLSGPLGAAGRKLDDFGAKAEHIGRKLESAGLRIGAIGTAGQAGLSRLGLDLNTLTGNAIDAEKALYGIANTAGFSGEKARVMVGEWTIAVNQIAVATNQSQDRITAAFNDMIAKGVGPESAVAMLKPIGQAATAAGADIQDMASAAQASFSKLQIPVEDVAKSLDIMAQAGKAGAFELRDMAGYFDKLTASASNLGIKGQEGLASLSAAAQIARRGTGDAAQAATNLDNFLTKLNASVTYKAFDKIGVDLEKLKTEAKASGDYLGYMAQEIQRLTGGDTARVAALFNDVQAGAFIQGMLRDLEDYKKIREESLAANGVAAQDFATAMQSAGAQIEAFKIAASGAVQSSEALKSMLATLKGVATWANENPELAKWLIFGTAGLAVGGAAIAGIGAIVTAIGSLSGALVSLAAFLAANPVVIAILGLGATAVASFKIGTFLSEQIDIALKAVSGGKFQSLGSAIYDMVQWFKELPARIKTALGGFVADMKKVGIQIVDGLIAGMKERARAFVDSVKGVGSDAYKGIKDFFGIKSPSTLMAEVGENIGLGMAHGIEASLPTVQAAASQLAEVIPVTLASQPRNADGSFKSRADAASQGTGMLGGLNEYVAGIQSVMAKAKDVVVTAFKGMEDALVQFVQTGKMDFKSLVDSILSDIARVAIQQSITQPLASFFGSLFASANGNAFTHAPALSAYSGQIVNKPTLFPFATGGVPNIGLMGETGNPGEAIMPLKRGPGGVLGVNAAGNVQVNVVNNASGTQATATERMEGNTRIIDVMIDQVRGMIAGDIAKGGNAVSGSIERTYGLNRTAGAY